MELVTRASAQRELLRIPLADRNRIERRIEAYLADPRSPHHDVVALIGRTNTFRLRVGDWRIVFSLDQHQMIVTRVAHRREVYR